MFDLLHPPPQVTGLLNFATPLVAGLILSQLDKAYGTDTYGDYPIALEVAFLFFNTLLIGLVNTFLAAFIRFVIAAHFRR